MKRVVIACPVAPQRGADGIESLTLCHFPPLRVDSGNSLRAHFRTLALRRLVRLSALSPTPGRSLAQAQADHVLAEERLAAFDAAPPSHPPDHAGRRVVSVEDRFPAHPAVIEPALGSMKPKLLPARRGSRTAAAFPASPLTPWRGARSAVRERCSGCGSAACRCRHATNHAGGSKITGCTPARSIRPKAKGCLRHRAPSVGATRRSRTYQGRRNRR